MVYLMSKLMFGMMVVVLVESGSDTDEDSSSSEEIEEVPIGGSCGKSVNRAYIQLRCAGGATCSFKTKKCTCPGNLQDDGNGLCKEFKYNGESCSSTQNCHIRHGFECIGNVCACNQEKTQYLENRMYRTPVAQLCLGLRGKPCTSKRFCVDGTDCDPETNLCTLKNNYAKNN